MASGNAIGIEEGEASEITSFAEVQVAPVDARAFKPAFDVNPHNLISALVTEKGIVEPAKTPASNLLASLNN